AEAGVFPPGETHGQRPGDAGEECREPFRESIRIDEHDADFHDGRDGGRYRDGVRRVDAGPDDAYLPRARHRERELLEKCVAALPGRGIKAEARGEQYRAQRRRAPDRVGLEEQHDEKEHAEACEPARGPEHRAYVPGPLLRCRRFGLGCRGLLVEHAVPHERSERVVRRHACTSSRCQARTRLMSTLPQTVELTMSHTASMKASPRRSVSPNRAIAVDESAMALPAISASGKTSVRRRSA